MINASDREHAVKLIQEAVHSGARLFKACEELGISKRTFNRWKSDTEDSSLKYIDRRTICKRPEPANKLSREEKKSILDVMHSKEYAELPPSQVVPRLADQGIYIASESSFYRVLREAGEIQHRGYTKPPVRREISTHVATHIYQGAWHFGNYHYSFGQMKNLEIGQIYMFLMEMVTCIQEKWE